MKSVYQFPPPDICDSTKYACLSVCLPIGQNCDTPGGAPTDDCETFSLELCGDDTFCPTMAAGDPLIVNMRFADRFSADITNPDVDSFENNIKVTLHDLDSEEDIEEGFVSETFSMFDGKPLQTAVIDTTKVPQRFKVSFEDTQSQRMETECFTLIDPECVPNFTIEGEWLTDKCDCTGPGTEFRRFQGYLEGRGGSVAKTRFGKKVTGKRTQNDFRAVIAEQMPPSEVNKFINTVLGADIVRINGQEVNVDSTQVTYIESTKVNGTGMIEFPFTYVCEIKGRCTT